MYAMTCKADGRPIHGVTDPAYGATIPLESNILGDAINELVYYLGGFDGVTVTVDDRGVVHSEGVIDGEEVDEYWTIELPPVGARVIFRGYDDEVHGVGFTPGTELVVEAHSSECGDDGLIVRSVDGRIDLVFASEVEA